MSKNDLRSLTKKELLDLARDRDLSGRSKMDKDELVAALQKKSGPAPVRVVRGKSAEKATAKEARKGTAKTAAKSAGKAPAKPAAESAAKPAAKSAVKPAAKPAAKKSSKPAAESPARAESDKAAASSGAERDSGDRKDVGGGRNPSPDRDDDRGRRDRSRGGRRRGRNDDRRSGGGHQDDDVDPWNRIDAADPNYGRFLNPQTAGFRRGRGGRGAAPGGPGAPAGDQNSNAKGRNQDRSQSSGDRSRGPGRSRNPQDRSRNPGDRSRNSHDRSRNTPDRNRNAQERSKGARDALRKSGEARSGVAYTPMYDNKSGDDDSRNRSRRSRRRDERRRRRGEGRGGDGGQQDSRRNEARASRPGVELPRVWREDGARREDYHRTRSTRGRDDDRRNDPRAEGHHPGRGDRSGNHPVRSFIDRDHEHREGGPFPSLDSLGLIGPVDPQEVRDELRSLEQRPSSRAETGKAPTSRCRILARDPYWLHVFWELDEVHVLEMARTLEVPFEDLRWVLRVHSLPTEANLSSTSQPPGFFDVEIGGDEQRTYVHVGLPNRDYRVDIGLLTDRGLFCPLASSNRVRTPRDTMEGEGGKGGPESAAAAGDLGSGDATGELAEKFYEESGGSPAPRIDRPEPPELQRNLEISRREPSGDGSGRRSNGTAGGDVGWTARDAGEGPEDDGGGGGGGAGGARARASHESGEAMSAGDGPMNRAPGGRSGSASQTSLLAGTSPGALPDAMPGSAPTSPSGEPAWVSSPGAQPTSPGARPTSPGVRPTTPGAWPTSPAGPISSSNARPAVQGPQPAADRGFWLAVQTELVVSGATEPDAKVTIQGIPIPLRPDGTFTVRFELPDGEQIVPVVAVSRDGRFEKEITPRVVRETERSARIHDPEDVDDAHGIAGSKPTGAGEPEVAEGAPRARRTKARSAKPASRSGEKKTSRRTGSRRAKDEG